MTKKTFNTYKVIRLLTWGIGGIALVIFYIWFEFFTPKVTSDRNQAVDFNPFVWAKSSQDYSASNPRRMMYLDLVQNHLTKGQGRLAIDKMLGTPDYIDNQKRYFYLLEYQINTSKFDYLVIQFNRDNKVVLYYRTQKSTRINAASNYHD